LGREGTFDVIGEERSHNLLWGKFWKLDLVVDPRTRKLIPNPASPETPMIEAKSIPKDLEDIKSRIESIIETLKSCLMQNFD